MDAIERLSAEFDDQFRRGWHSAAQLVLLHRGTVVLERASGRCGSALSAPVTPTTPFRVFSIGKSLLALCIHHLVDRGRIGLDDKLSDHWPEFASHGKASCTIRHVLLHQTGLAKRDALRQLGPLASWERTIARLERARPDFAPGTKTAYQPLNYGFLLAELLQRVTGQTPQDYLAEHFLRPMELRETTWFPSAAQVEAAPRLEARELGQAASAWLFNRRYLRGRPSPAFNLFSTARELAALFLLLAEDGCYRGARYLSQATVREATALHFRGIDLTIGRETLWALGFHLGGFKREHAWRPGPAMGAQSSIGTFGHCGHMSSIVWADREDEVVFAFTCNGLLSSSRAALRWQRLADLAWSAVRVDRSETFQPTSSLTR